MIEECDTIVFLYINNMPMCELGLAWGWGTFSTYFQFFVLWAQGPWGPWAHGQRPLGPMGPISNRFVIHIFTILKTFFFVLNCLLMPIVFRIELPIEMPSELPIWITAPY